ncbi:MAG: methyltransferase domain-containing protein [bacterium]
MVSFGLMYDFFMEPLDALKVKAWRRWVVSVQGERVLEIGVGTGLNLPRYQASKKLFVLDPRRDFLIRARRRARASSFNRSPEFMQAMGEGLPFQNGVFDAAVFSWVLCTVLDPMSTLQEISRVLKPGGTIRLLEHVRLKGGLPALFQDLMTPAWSRLAGGCHLNRDAVHLVHEAGFKNVQVVQMLGKMVVGIEAFKPLGNL